MRLLIYLCLLSVSVIALSAPIAPLAPEKARVLRLLDGYEWQLSAERFHKLPEDTYLTLIEIATDESARSFTRGRAMAALSLYENESVWQFFHGQVTGSGLPTQRRRAVEGICSVFLVSRSAQLKQALLPLLASTDAHLRVRIAQCLVEINNLGADGQLEAALSAYQDTITEPWERRAAGFKAP